MSKHDSYVKDYEKHKGAEHRRSIFGTSQAAGNKFYKWIIKSSFPEGFQTLCWNCNCGKRMHGGICPHQVKEE